MELKLNNKRTILVGLAFLSISAFWQMYDSVMTLILTGTFQLNETVSGAIMAADNVLALFLLPLFGAISDRTETRIGRRMPFILGGTAAAVVLMNLLPMLDNRYAAAPSPVTLAGFVAVLALLLVAMGTYRSPAVALMPDVTPKPLRSKGNAIINLMGAVGGILYLAVAAVMYPTSRTEGAVHVDYQPLFLVVSLIMAAAVVVLFFTVREPKLAEENRRLEAAHPEWDLAEDDGSGHETLPAPVKRSLGFLLVSISLWFIAYNGVTTWFTRYVAEVMGEGLGGASTCLLVATAGAIVSYIPVGAAASRFGRKKTILFGGGPAGGLLPAGLRPHHRLQLHPADYVPGLRPGGGWPGPPSTSTHCPGGGDVQGLGHRQVHRLLLHLLHGRQVVTPIAAGALIKRRGLPGAVPLRRLLRRPGLCHHVLRRHGDVKAAGKRGLDAFGDMD